jgi:hypothetical protein
MDTTVFIEIGEITITQVIGQDYDHIGKIRLFSAFVAGDHRPQKHNPCEEELDGKR